MRHAAIQDQQLVGLATVRLGGNGRWYVTDPGGMVAGPFRDADTALLGAFTSLSGFDGWNIDVVDMWGQRVAHHWYRR